MKDTYYITIGWEKSNIPMANKVMIYFDSDSETLIQAAKRLRKQFADRPYNHGYSIDTKPFKPSSLFWAVYESRGDTCPVFFSANTPACFTGTN